MGGCPITWAVSEVSEGEITEREQRKKGNRERKRETRKERKKGKRGEREKGGAAVSWEEGQMSEMR